MCWETGDWNEVIVICCLSGNWRKICSEEGLSSPCLEGRREGEALLWQVAHRQFYLHLSLCVVVWFSDRLAGSIATTWVHSSDKIYARRQLFPNRYISIRGDIREDTFVPLWSNVMGEVMSSPVPPYLYLGYLLFASDGVSCFGAPSIGFHWRIPSSHY